MNKSDKFFFKGNKEDFTLEYIFMSFFFSFYLRLVAYILPKWQKKVQK